MVLCRGKCICEAQCAELQCQEITLQARSSSAWPLETPGGLHRNDVPRLGHATAALWLFLTKA